MLWDLGCPPWAGPAAFLRYAGVGPALVAMFSCAAPVLQAQTMRSPELGALGP